MKKVIRKKDVTVKKEFGKKSGITFRKSSKVYVGVKGFRNCLFEEEFKHSSLFEKGVTSKLFSIQATLLSCSSFFVRIGCFCPTLVFSKGG